MIEYNIYKNGCMRMLTMSFDDGQINARRLIELLNKYNLKSTFNLNSACFGRERRVGRRLTADEAKALLKGTGLYE